MRGAGDFKERGRHGCENRQKEDIYEPPYPWVGVAQSIGGTGWRRLRSELKKTQKKKTRSMTERYPSPNASRRD